MLVPEVAEPMVRLALGAPLRLADGPYPFDEPPDLIRLATRAERLDCLKQHLQSLCPLWDKLARRFLDAYFAWIDATVAAGTAELQALADRAGGLFAPADWSFAALRPLPQAHLPADDGAPVRADLAFWTGTSLVAIEMLGTMSPRKQRREELARLAAAGAVLVEIEGAALEREGERLLAQTLPPAFAHFWRGVALPSSPFGPAALDEIRLAD